MTRPVTFLFDMDGVLARFVDGAIKAHGAALDPDAAEWDFCSQIGFAGPGDPAFWAPLENPDFWAALDPHEDGLRLFRAVTALVPRERVGFLSDGSRRGASDGKRAWVKRHLPGWEKHLVLGTAKHLVAAPCKLLVDDHDPNVDGFAGAGGRAVLVPRPWNARKGETDGRGRFDVDAVLAELLLAAGV